MATTYNSTSTRRKYTRRTDEQRIADLEKRIAELKERQAVKDRKLDPVLKEIPKVQRRLRKFVKMAIENDRLDIANSTRAFMAGLERTLHGELKSSAPNSQALEAES